MNELHDPTCSAVVPCPACQDHIGNAREARHGYQEALKALDDLASMPWVLNSVHGDSKAFNKAYDALRDLCNDAHRQIPQPL